MRDDQDGAIATNIAIRPATAEDLDWLHELASSESVEPFLSPGAPAGLDEAVERGEMLVAEAPPGTRAGAVCVVVTAPRSRMAAIRTLMIDPAARGHGLATSLIRALARRLLVDGDLHRLEADVYAFNAAGRRTFEAAGFTVDGIRRRAYLRHGDWHDGILLGLVAEDLG
jgi:RimJ/RimL family protein N-acetyltransferase